MYLSGSSLRFRKQKKRDHPRRIIFLLLLLLGGVFLLGLYAQGQVQPLGQPTLGPTRNPQSYLEEAKAQFAAGHLKQAIAAYQKAKNADSENVDIVIALARTQILDEQFEAAVKTTSEALVQDNEHPKLNAIHAWALDKVGRLDEAQAAALKAISLDNTYAPAHAYYSEILNDGGFWDQGFAEAQTALQLDPNLFESRWAMGYSNEVVGLYQNAIEHYEQAVTLNPNLWVIYIKLGVMYRDGLQKPDLALQYFSKANALDPENIQPFLYLSRTYYQIDKLGTAIQYLEQALRYEPTNPDIYGRLGLLLFKRKNYEGAEPVLRLAVFGGPLTDANGQIMVEGITLADGAGASLSVVGMPLTAASLEYYYTLGNLRAYIASLQNPESCGPDPDDAPALLRAAFNFAPEDPTVIGSYTESMKLCDQINQGIAPATDTPEATSAP